MLKHIVVSRCTACPHAEFDPVAGGVREAEKWVCMHKFFWGYEIPIIKELSEIPGWCPLEDCLSAQGTTPEGG